MKRMICASKDPVATVVAIRKDLNELIDALYRVIMDEEDCPQEWEDAQQLMYEASELLKGR